MSKGRERCERAESLALVAVLVLAQVVYVGGATDFVGSGAAISDDVNLLPVVEIVPDVSSGKAPLEVQKKHGNTEVQRGGMPFCLVGTEWLWQMVKGLSIVLMLNKGMNYGRCP